MSCSASEIQPPKTPAAAAPPRLCDVGFPLGSYDQKLYAHASPEEAATFRDKTVPRAVTLDLPLWTGPALPRIDRNPHTKQWVLLVKLDPTSNPTLWDLTKRCCRTGMDYFMRSHHPGQEWLDEIPPHLHHNPLPKGCRWEFDLVHSFGFGRSNVVGWYWQDPSPILAPSITGDNLEEHTFIVLAFPLLAKRKKIE